MKTKFLLLLSLCCFFAFLSAEHSHAAIYKYLNKDGLISFANDLQSVPEQYRASATVVSGDTDQEDHQSIQDRQTPGQATGNHGDAPALVHDKAVETRNENSFFNSRLLLTAIVVVSAVFAFIVLGILETDHKKTVAVIRIALVWAVAIYLLIAHAGDAVRMVRTVGGTIEVTKHQSEEKGKKAAKAVKAWGELMEQAAQTPLADPPETDREKKE